MYEKNLIPRNINFEGFGVFERIIINVEVNSMTVSNMYNSKILDNIEPFNDIFYKSCFYNAFFPVVIHFNKSIFPFLLNDIYIYDYDKTSYASKLNLRVLSIESEKQLLENKGIIINTKTVSNDILTDIVTAIWNENPVIIFIDCFYESIRPDMYQKEHGLHSLLIYGYNQSEQMFDIVEHQYRDSLLYEKRIISYSDIVNSYNGALTLLGEDNELTTYHEYSLNQNNLISTDINEYINAFKNGMLNKKELIFEKLSCLKAFMTDIYEIISNELLLNKSADNLMISMNDIINTKGIQIYSIKKVFAHQTNLISLLEQIIHHWSLFRAVLGKFQYTSKYNPKSLNNSFDKLLELYDLEYQYHESLFEFLNTWGI